MFEEDKESMMALMIALFDALSPEGRAILFDEVIAHAKRETD